MIKLDLETFFTASAQLKLFLLSCAFGIPIGMVYDIFRIFRITVPHNNILVIIEDLIFFILYSIFVMAFTVSAARADFRVYYIIGNILGFTLYYFTVGSIVTGIFIKISCFIKKIFKLFFKFFRYVSIFFIKIFTFSPKKAPEKSKKN